MKRFIFFIGLLILAWWLVFGSVMVYFVQAHHIHVLRNKIVSLELDIQESRKREEALKDYAGQMDYQISVLTQVIKNEK